MRPLNILPVVAVVALAGPVNAAPVDCPAFLQRTYGTAKGLHDAEPLASYALYEAYLNEQSVNACPSPQGADLRTAAQSSKKLIRAKAVEKALALFGAEFLERFRPGGPTFGEGGSNSSAPVTIVSEGNGKSLSGAIVTSVGQGSDREVTRWLLEGLATAGVSKKLQEELASPVRRKVFLDAADRIYERRLADWTEAESAPSREIFWKGFAGQLENELTGTLTTPLADRTRSYAAIEAFLQRERSPVEVKIPARALDALLRTEQSPGEP